MNKGGDHSVLRFIHQKPKRLGGSGGFTIVETMIVLAVTGILFVSAAVVINGRQNKTAFQTAVNSLQQQLQQIINETASGYYPNNAKFTCSGVTSPVTIAAAGTNNQGQNAGCTFVGKAIRFGSGACTTTGGHNTNFIVYPLAGNQKDAAGNEVTDITAARPTAIAPATVSDCSSGFPNDSTPYSTESGLTFEWTKKLDGVTPFSPNNVSTIAFVSTFGSYTGGRLNSGSQQLNLYGVKNTPTTITEAAAASAINSTSNLFPLDGLTVCFNSGTTNQSGVFTIGGNGSLSVSLQVQSKQCGP